jgi:hypothetical protein
LRSGFLRTVPPLAALTGQETKGERSTLVTIYSALCFGVLHYASALLAYNNAVCLVVCLSVHIYVWIYRYVGSDLCQDTSYPDFGFDCGFSKPVQANKEIVP